MKLRAALLRPTLVAALALLTILADTGALAQDDAPDDRRDGPRGRQFDRGDRGGRFGRGPGGPGMMGGFGALLRPEFTRRDGRFINEALSLDAAQREILEVLLLDYEAGWEELSETGRERMRELRPQRDEDPVLREQRREAFGELREAREAMRDLRRSAGENGVPDEAEMEKIRARFDAVRERMEALRPQRPQGAELQEMLDGFTDLSAFWREGRATLRREFLDGLRASLGERQVESWDGFLRSLRREHALPDGRLSGESVNLFQLLREQRLQDHPELAESLEAYAFELDAALRARNEVLESGVLAEVFQASMNGDVERAEALLVPERDARVAVRTVNERHRDAIAARIGEAVSPEAAETFVAAYHERAFPRIHGPTTTERAFRVALGFEDLDEETRAAITALSTEHAGRISTLNATLVAATRAEEPDENIERMRRRAERDGERGERPEDPVREAFQARRELDDDYRDRLEGLLTEAQVAELPARPRERWAGRGRGGFEAGREAFMQRFDTDGDGEISDTERDAIREFFQNRRDEGRGRAPGEI